MGNVCCSTLIPENYPPERRNMRHPTNVEADVLNSSPRRSTVKKTIHVMSYNILADYLATPDYGHDV